MFHRKIDQHVIAFDADRKRGDPKIVADEALAGCRIEWPRVPGTRYDAAVFFTATQSALAEWSAMMRARAPHGTDFAADVAERVRLVAVEDFNNGAVGEFGEAGEFPESQLSVYVMRKWSFSGLSRGSQSPTT